MASSYFVCVCVCVCVMDHFENLVKPSNPFSEKCIQTHKSKDRYKIYTYVLESIS